MSLWTSLCSCGNPVYFNNPACSGCMGMQAQTRRKGERQEQKQAQLLTKQRERSKGSKVAIKPVSKKQSAESAELARIKKELLAENPVCFSSGENSNLTLSHIITRREKQWATDRNNLVLENMHVHQIWEHNKTLFAQLYPEAWRLKLLRVKAMSTEYFYKLLNQLDDDIINTV